MYCIIFLCGSYVVLDVVVLMWFWMFQLESMFRNNLFIGLDINQYKTFQPALTSSFANRTVLV